MFQPLRGSYPFGFSPPVIPKAKKTPEFHTFLSPCLEVAQLRNKVINNENKDNARMINNHLLNAI